MKLFAEADAATRLIEVVEISDRELGFEYSGNAVAHRIGIEATDFLTFIETLPGNEKYRCLSPRWIIRAYEDSLDLLF